MNPLFVKYYSMLHMHSSLPLHLIIVSPLLSSLDDAWRNTIFALFILYCSRCSLRLMIWTMLALFILYCSLCSLRLMNGQCWPYLSVLFPFLLPSPHGQFCLIYLVLFPFLLPSPHDMDNVGLIYPVLFPFLLPSPHDMDNVGLIYPVLFPFLLPSPHGYGQCLPYLFCIVPFSAPFAS